MNEETLRELSASIVETFDGLMTIHQRMANRQTDLAIDYYALHGLMMLNLSELPPAFVATAEPILKRQSNAVTDIVESMTDMVKLMVDFNEQVKKLMGENKP